MQEKSAAFANAVDTTEFVIVYQAPKIFHPNPGTHFFVWKNV